MVYKQNLTLQISVLDAAKPLTYVLNEAMFTVTAEPSQDFLNLIESSHFTRRGRLSWSTSLTENRTGVKKFFAGYAKNYTPGTLLYAQEPDTFEATSALTKTGRNQSLQPGISALLRAGLIPRASVPDLSLTPEHRRDLQTVQYRYGEQRGEVKRKYLTTGYVNITVIPQGETNIMWVRLVPANEIRELSNLISIPKMKGVKRTVNRAYTINQVREEVLDKMKDIYPDEVLLDSKSDEAVQFLKEAENHITVGYVPNHPGKVLFRVGSNIKLGSTHRLKKYTTSSGKKRNIPLPDALEYVRTYPNLSFQVHPALKDVLAMSQAEPYEGDDRLHLYQKEAVGVHLATRIGMLQSCSAGLGKTVMQLAGMRARAATIEHYRGLVVVEANVREQWEEEAGKWFPEADVFRLETSKDLDGLVEALSSTNPVLVIISYAQTLLAYDVQQQRDEENMKLAAMTMKQQLKYFMAGKAPELSIGGLLLDTHYHDICADEAVVLRNGSSKQANIMWTLRKNSDVATALTATPINRGPDDIARLLAWVRNDRNLFTGASLSEQYDTTSPKEAKKLYDMFGPLVFRRDTSEVKGKIPTVKQTVETLTPNPAEKALSNAAEQELKRCYTELLTALDAVEETAENSEDKDAVREAKQQLREANGAWLGGKQLARMAVSDAEALLESESVGAALLQAQGLIEAALAETPTKRKKFLEIAQKQVQSGKQLLVFTDFARVAKVLVEVLQANGINAKAYTGKQTATARNKARKEFQDGNLDVLVCTKAAERGLTLHKASVIVHYDLPWTIERIIQRVGRGVRLGSENPEVSIMFLIMKDTVEHRMAEQLVNSGIAAALILDAARGVDISETEIAAAMGDLITDVSFTTENKNVREFGKMLLKL